MLAEEQLLSYVLIILCTFIALLARARLRINPAGTLMDVRIIFIGSTIIYAVLPLVMLLLSSSKTLYSESYESQLEVSRYLIYMMALLFLSYLPNFKFAISNPFASRCLKNKISSSDFRASYLACLVISVYSLAILFFILPDSLKMLGNRAWASEYKALLNETFKLNLSLFLLVGFVSLLVIRSGRLRYLLFFMPYIIIDGLLTDRGFIFSILIVSLYNYINLGGKFKFRFLFYILLILYSIEFFRSPWNIDALRESGLTVFLTLPGELLGTTSASFIVYESGVFTNQFEYLLSNIFFAWLPKTLRPDFNYIVVANVLDQKSPFSWGLGGSMLSEAFILGSIIYIYPFIIIAIAAIYGFVVKRLPGFFGYILFLYVVASIIMFQRSGFVSTGFLPFYYLMCFYAALSIFKFLFVENKLRPNKLKLEILHDHK